MNFEIKGFKCCITMDLKMNKNFCATSKCELSLGLKDETLTNEVTVSIVLSNSKVETKKLTF